MNIMLVAQCSKRALVETRRILDQFAERRGDRTWQTAITLEGLNTLRCLLRKTARRHVRREGRIRGAYGPLYRTPRTARSGIQHADAVGGAVCQAAPGVGGAHRRQFSRCGQNVVGERLRLHGSQAALTELEQHGWRKGLRDYTESSAILPVPAGAAYRTVRRVQVKSLSNGQSFLLFIEQGMLRSTPTAGEFSAYGLSAIATVPWF